MACFFTKYLCVAKVSQTGLLCQQVDPDPEFPTVKYPNPEEGKGALVSTHLTKNLLISQE